MQQCVHGAMTRRQGTKNGREWVGWFCPAPKGTQGQCSPIFEKSEKPATGAQAGANAQLTRIIELLSNIDVSLINLSGLISTNGSRAAKSIKEEEVGKEDDIHVKDIPF